MADLTETFHKLPKWAWIAGLVGAGGLALWYSRSQSSAPAATPAASVPGSADQAPNTSTPTGSSVCPTYPLPTCPSGQFLIPSTDSNGCLLFECSGAGSGGGGTPIGPVCHSTLHGGTYIVGKSGSLTTLRQIFASVGQDVNCALQWNPSAINRGLDTPLWSGFVVYY